MSESLLPPSATRQERALDASTARVGEVPVPIGEMWDADTCPLELLPWLAWALSIDLWDDAWTEERKREELKAAVGYHRTKGTVASVRAALQPYGADIIEWFNDNPVATPHTFIVSVPDGTTDSVLARVIRAAQKTKNARSHFAFRKNVDSDLIASAVGVSGEVTGITPSPPVSTWYEDYWELTSDALHNLVHAVIPTRIYI